MAWTWVIGLLIAAQACSSAPTSQPFTVVDLTERFSSAETRPIGANFQVAYHTVGVRSLPTVVAPVPSRITWQTFVPRHGTLVGEVALAPGEAPSAVSVRFGISDGRVYETLVERIVTSEESGRGWVRLEASLSRYAGPQWSLFYRPGRTLWTIVVGIAPADGNPSRVDLGGLAIQSDANGARHFRSQHGPA